MSNIKANSAIQTINLTTNKWQAKKIAIKPGQAIQLMVDGQLYAGQQHINGKAVRLIRKGRTLEVQLDEQTLAVVEDFYANEGAATGQTQALSEQDTLALLQESSAVQVAAAPAGAAAGTVPLPQWGTLVAQASTSTAGNAPATVAAASAVPEATGMDMGTALLGVLGLAALAGASGSKSSSPAPMSPDTTAPTVMVTDNVSGTATGAVTFTVKFSEAVTGFDASKLSLSGGTLGGLVRVSDIEYTVQATPAANATGTLQLSVSTSGVTDAAGNLVVAPAVAAQAYNTVPPDTPDTTAPTVLVTDNVSGTATGAVTFTVKFSEAVTGFVASKLSLSGGTLGSLVKVSDSEYTVVATPAANATGTLQLSVSTGGVTDAAGNLAVAPAVAEQAYAQNVLQGNIVAGPVVGSHQLSVKVFNAAGQAIAVAIIDANGNYKVGLGSYSGPVSVLVIDSDNAKPDYMDEFKKQAVDLTANLLAAGNVINSASVQTININPITTVAANKAGVQATADGQAVQATTLSSSELASKISQSNIAVAKALNIGSSEGSLLSSSVVATVTAAGQENLINANTYGKVLATLSALDQIKGSTEAAILALVQNITDQGTLSTSIQTQLVQAATMANVPATTVVPGYQPPATEEPADPVLSMSFAGKTADETATLLSGLSSNQKSLLSAAQGQQIGVDQLDSLISFAGLSANFVGGLAANVLASAPNELLAVMTSDQAAVADLSSLLGPQVLQLLPAAIDSVPPDVIDNLSPTQVANLSLAQVQALTGPQLQALATAGLLDDLAHPLTNAQITSDSPAGLGLTTLGNNIGQTGIEAGLFNEIINTQSLVTGTDATDTANKLSNIASVVDRIAAAAAGQTVNPALTEDDFTAIGITGVTTNNLSAVLTEIAASADNGSGIASLSAIRTLIAPDAITNLSLLSAGDSGESNADRLTNAAILTFSGTARKGASVSVWVDADGDNVVDNGETQTVTADANTGAFTTANATATVANGLVRATATQTDGTGNSPVSQTLVTERDTTAPTLQSATVNGNQLVLAYSHPLDATNLPDLSKYTVLLQDGRVTPPTIALTNDAPVVNGNTLVLTLATRVNAGQVITFSYTDAVTTDNVSGVLQDLAGNDVGDLTNQTVVNATGDNRVLGVPSAISVDEAVNSLNAIEASNGTVVRVQLAGTNALANDVVEVRWQKVGAGSEVVTGVVTATHINTQNYIDITVPNGVILAVGDGSVNVAARVVKAGFAANASGAASLYTSDLPIVVAAQVQPAAVTFTLDADDDSGTSQSDLITAKTSGLTFNGTTVANATVEFFDDTNSDGVRQNNESLGTVDADSSGLFVKDIALTAPGRVDGQLGDSINGVHALRVIVTDTQGNVVISSQVDVTIDTVAPAPATLSLHSASDTGVIGDNLTQNTQGIRLTGNTASANEDILIFKDVNQNQRYDSGDILIAETTSNGQSVFDVVLAGNLQEGEHILSVQTAPDTAGNFSVALQTVKVDNSVPVLDMTTPGLAANNTVTINYAEPLDTGSVPAAGAFTVTDSSNTTHTVTAVSVNGNAVVLTLLTTLPGSGTVSVVYAPANAGASPLQDAAGNDALAFNQSGIAIDSTAPAISTVLTSTAAGSYAVGDTVNIAVQFDNAVQVGGDTSNLRLVLDITNNGTPVTARYAGISGNHVVFQYTVAAGDSAQTGASIGASQLKLGAATISSLSGVTLAGGPDIALSGASELTNGGNITINSASTGGFKYNAITGNTLWLDASDSTSLYNDGAQATASGEVDEWRDKSGTNHHFTNTGNATVTPNYLSTGLTGNLPAVRFDKTTGINSLTSETLVSSTRNGEWFFITDLSQGTNAGLVSSRATNTTYLTGYGIFQTNSGGQLYIGASGNTVYAPLSYTAPSSGEALLSNYVFSSNATTGTMNVNTFNNQGSYSSSLNNPRGNQGYEGAGVSLGSPINGWDKQPDISEVLYFDHALTTAERQSVQIALAEKWGLTTALGTSVTAAANTDMSAVGTGSELVHQRSLGSDGVENFTVAGADVLRAGGGNDTVLAVDNNFRILDGGAGNDTLKFNVGGSINLTGMVSQYLGNTLGLHQLQRFEKIDINNDSLDTLILTLADVLQLSDSQSLVVKGNAGDTVQLNGSGWATDGLALAWDGNTYAQYTNGVGSVLVTPGLTVVL